MNEDLSSNQASQGSIREHRQALAGPPASCSQHHCWQDKESLVVWFCYPSREKGVWQSCPVPLTSHRQRLLLRFHLGPISSLPAWTSRRASLARSTPTHYSSEDYFTALQTEWLLLPLVVWRTIKQYDHIARVLAS